MTNILRNRILTRSLYENTRDKEIKILSKPTEWIILVEIENFQNLFRMEIPQTFPVGKIKLYSLTPNGIFKPNAEICLDKINNSPNDIIIFMKTALISPYDILEKSDVNILKSPSKIGKYKSISRDFNKKNYDNFLKEFL